jgi:hypothetical protein
MTNTSLKNIKRDPIIQNLQFVEVVSYTYKLTKYKLKNYFLLELFRATTAIIKAEIEITKGKSRIINSII